MEVLSGMLFQRFFSYNILSERKTNYKNKKWNVHSYHLVIISPVVRGPQKNQTTARYIFFIKYSKVKPCLKCGKGTWSKLQICNTCGGNKIRVNERYHTKIKPFNSESHRLRNISVTLQPEEYNLVNYRLFQRNPQSGVMTQCIVFLIRKFVRQFHVYLPRL